MHTSQTYTIYLFILGRI